MLGAVLREVRENAADHDEQRGTQRLDELIARLERAAEQLRSGELSPDAAATMVEDCAVAGDPGGGRARAADARRGPRPGARPGHPSVGTRTRPPTRPLRCDRHATRSTCARRSSATWRRCSFAEEPITQGLDEAMRYSLLAGGKRIRPVLALATARAVGMEQREVLPLAGAIELIHTYSLIHDDLPAMDDDELRRGAPTCHVKFGEDVAILAGDALYAEAFHHLLTRQRSAPERVLAAAAELAAATGVNGMVGGQYADVKRAHRLRSRRAATAARAEDRPSDRCVGALRTTVDGDRRRSRDGPLPPVRRRAGRAVPDRRRHT